MGVYPNRVQRAFPGLCDMSPRSRFMGEYAELLQFVAPTLVSFATTHDKIVPHRSSYVAGARNVLVVSSYGEYLWILQTYGDSIELRLEPKSMGHISSVIHRQCKDFARDFVGGDRLKLVS